MRKVEWEWRGWLPSRFQKGGKDDEEKMKEAVPPENIQILSKDDPEAKKGFKQERRDWTGLTRLIRGLQSDQCLKLTPPEDMTLEKFRTQVATAGKRIHGTKFRIKTSEGIVFCSLSCGYCIGKGKVCQVCKENTRNCKCTLFIPLTCPYCKGKNWFRFRSFYHYIEKMPDISYVDKQ